MFSCNCFYKFELYFTIMRVNKPKYQVCKTVYIFNYNILLVMSSVCLLNNTHPKIKYNLVVLSVSLLCLSWGVWVSNWKNIILTVKVIKLSAMRFLLVLFDLYLGKSELLSYVYQRTNPQKFIFITNKYRYTNKCLK